MKTVREAREGGRYNYITSADVMTNLFDCIIDGDWSPENLPKIKSTEGMRRTDEAQKLVEYAHSKKFRAGDPTFDLIEKGAAAATEAFYQMARATVYTCFAEGDEKIIE